MRVKSHRNKRYDLAKWDFGGDISSGSFACLLRQLVEFAVSEVESNVYRDLDKVQNVEEEAEEKDESRAAACSLDDLSRDSESIADEEKDLKEETLALGCAGNDRFAN